MIQARVRGARGLFELQIFKERGDVLMEDDDIMANAYGLAALHLQNAILTMLVSKGALTPKECAKICNGALHVRENKHPSPWHELTRQILTTLARGWDTQPKDN